MRVIRFWRVLTLIAAAALTTSAAQAAFIVEADNVAPAGKANDHFTSTGNGFSTAFSAAVGLTANQSAFGSNAAATPDVYTIRYTPGVDIDNTPLVAGTSLGNSSATDNDGLGAGLPTYVTANLPATGLVGGASGIYDVYFTIPTTTNVEALGSQFSIASDLGAVLLNPVNNNNGGTGPDEVAGGTYTGGANNRWLKIATVQLTAGTQYTVVMTSNGTTSTSQRLHGIMWEYVGPVVPEPATLSLAALGLLGAFATRRRS